MTRYTNFARKRTYVEAGFNHENEASEPASAPTPAVDNADVPENDASSSEPKKRKRIRSKKTKFDDPNAGDGNGDAKGDDGDGEENSERQNKRANSGDKNKSGRKFDKRLPRGKSSPRFIYISYRNFFRRRCPKNGF